MPPRQAPKQARPAVRPGAGVAVEDGSSDELCTCCEPRNPLVMRPDLGQLADGSAEFALCVLHEPAPTVYRNRGDGVYVQAPKLSLNPAGEIVDQAGNLVARVAGTEHQRLTTVDDDEPPPAGDGGGSDPGPGADRASRPRSVHVDLSQDDFYRGTRQRP
ncbi:MAG: hypothetical protein ACOY3Y_10515 [Acidobacteriota bacterium]